MSVYVGIDVHRKRSQVAVVGDDGRVALNRNVVNGSPPMLALLGGLPPGTPVAFEAAFGWGWLAGLHFGAARADLLAAAAPQIPGGRSCRSPRPRPARPVLLAGRPGARAPAAVQDPSAP